MTMNDLDRMKPKMKKSEIYRRAANQFLNLIVDHNSERQNWCLDFHNDLEEYAYRPSYMCDAIGNAVMTAGLSYIFADEMRKAMMDYGLLSLGFTALEDIEPAERQEARWFFLMFMAEVCDDNE